MSSTGRATRLGPVGIDRRVLREVQEWAREREQWGATPGAPLFCTRSGGPIQQAYVRELLPRLAKRAGVTKRAHAHALRHTFAVELAREGVPMPLIQQLLGHSSLAVTSVYLASLSPEEALDAVRNREW